jgi:hypothetical protein
VARRYSSLKSYDRVAMTAEARYVSKRLLTIFQETWAERDALRVKHKIEVPGVPQSGKRFTLPVKQEHKSYFNLHCRI